MTSELIETIKQSLGITIPERPELLSPLDLAYVGDNVYEMCNRLLALRAGSRQVEKLHKECSYRASAKTQSVLALFLEPEFTEEEKKVYLRGRNAQVYTKAKNATITEYHQATGLEAVIGFLFLRGEYDRLTALLRKGWEEIGEIEKKNQ